MQCTSVYIISAGACTTLLFMFLYYSFYINILLYKLCQNKCSRKAREIFLFGMQWKIIDDKRNWKRVAVEKL